MSGMAQTNGAAATGSPADTKPVVIAAAFVVPGHTYGPLQVCTYLVEQGYHVYGIFGSHYEAAVVDAGIVYIENDFLPDPVYLKERDAILDPLQRVIGDMRNVFCTAIPGQHTLLKQTMARVREEHPSRPVVLLQELLYMGVLPFHCGAALPQGYESLPPVIGFSPFNRCETDHLIPPFGPGLPYDPTEENLVLWKSMHESMEPLVAEMNDFLDDVFKTVGSTRKPTGWLFDALSEPGDITVFPASASTDYPRTTDTGNRFRYIGGLPLKPVDPNISYPAWWRVITENAALPRDSPQRKQVVFVTQGTMATNPSELLSPTIRALASRADFIVVATLGTKSKTLSAEELGIAVPENTMVIDYLSYDVMLPFTDVFVSNAGYGGFMHGVMNGVPMLLAGTDADKGEVAGRAAYSGVAVNLRTATPTEEQIRIGVTSILEKPSFKEKALALKKENEDMDSLAALSDIIDRLGSGRGL